MRARAAAPPTTCGTCSPPPARCHRAMSTWPEPSSGSSGLLGGDRASRRQAAGAGLRHLAGDAPAACQRRNSHQARTPTANARNNIRAAASLLAWLRSRRTTLARRGKATSTSGCAPGRQPCLARDFLTWAASRGHCQRLTSPPRHARPAPPSARTSDGHWPPGCCTTPRSTPPTGSPAACSCSTASRCRASPS